MRQASFQPNVPNLWESTLQRPVCIAVHGKPNSIERTECTEVVGQQEACVLISILLNI